MAEPRVDLYCEDRGHEQFARALVRRIAGEIGMKNLTPRTIVAAGGHGRAVSEFKAWQRTLSRGASGTPELLVLLIDGNCEGWQDVRRKLSALVDAELIPTAVVGCPDPHVERWCMADPESFAKIVGGPPAPDPGKCERSLYKTLLRQSILDAGQVILTDEMEYAEDLVREMNLFRAEKAQPSLKSFVSDLRAALKRLHDGSAP